MSAPIITIPRPLPWIYVQSTGELISPDGETFHGYAGHAEGRNNPDMQGVLNVGPIPRGWWRIRPARTNRHLGPLAFPLEPMVGTETYGRCHFWLHGDNAVHDASEGCIVQDHRAREAVDDSEVRHLWVVATPKDVNLDVASRAYGVL